MKKLFITLLFIFSAHCIFSQWIRTNGPYGSGVTAFAVVGTDIYAGCWDKGIYRSSDFGKNWKEVNSELKIPSGGIVASGSNIFANGWFFISEGILMTSDRGETWIPRNSGLPIPDEDFQIWELGVDMGNVYAVTTHGLFISGDDGLNWKAAADLSAQTWTAAFRDSNIFLGTDKGVYISENHGETWLQAGLGDEAIPWIAVQDSFIFCSALLTVFRSSDKGLNWIEIEQFRRETPNYFTCFYVSGDRIYAVQEDVYMSSDYGESWSNLFSDEETFSVAVLNDIIFAGTAEGVYISENEGADWIYSSTGIKRNYAANEKFHVYNQQLYFTFQTILNGTQLFSADEQQMNWKKINNNIAKAGISMFAETETMVFAGTDNGVYSTPAGSSDWIEAGLSGINITFLAAKDTVLFAYGYQLNQYPKLYRSFSSGAAWEELTDIYSVYSIFFFGDLMFMAAKNNFYSSSDYGNTLTLVGRNKSFGNLKSSGSFIYALVVNNIYRSLDSCKTWEFVGNGWFSDFCTYQEKVIAVLYDSLGDQQMGYITNEDTSWTILELPEMNSEYPAHIYDYAVFGSDLFIKYDEGIWKRSLLDNLTSTRKEEGTPGKFSLDQNYPNPFNPSTSIKFSVSSPGQVSIKIFDIIGNEIETLLSEEKNPGTYTIKWNAGQYTSGVYFCRLQAGDLVVTKKMMLMK
jgi:photosystem II stability/assembly factor-like uncharacterized protein